MAIPKSPHRQGLAHSRALMGLAAAAVADLAHYFSQLR
jgi:hypothetical protein